MATNPLPRRPPRPPGSPAGDPEAPPPSPSPAPKPAPARLGPGARLAIWVALGALSAGLVLFMVIQLVPLWLDHDHDHDTLPFRKHPIDLPQPAHVALFREAKQRILANDWIGAKEKLLEVKRLAPPPGFAEGYLEIVEREIPNQQHLEAAKAALDRGELARAQSELGAVAPDTRMYERVQQLRQELQVSAEENLRQAKILLDTGQRTRALLLVKEGLAVFPNSPEALRLHEQATQPFPGVSPAMARFLDGDLHGATTLALVCTPPWPECKKERKAFTEFSILYNKGGTVGTEGLVRLIALDKELAGALHPSQLLQARRTELTVRAKATFLQAYAVKDTEPKQALGKLREVLALTVPGDELHEKSKGWIDKLQR